MAATEVRPYFAESLDEIGRNLLNHTLDPTSLLHITRNIPLEILFNFQYTFNYHIGVTPAFNNHQKKAIFAFMRSGGGQRLLMDIYNIFSHRNYINERIIFAIRDGLDEDDVDVLKKEYERYDVYDLIQVIIQSNKIGKDATEDSKAYIEKIRPDYALKKGEYKRKLAEYESLSEEEKVSKHPELRVLHDQLQEMYDKTFDPEEIYGIVKDIQDIVIDVLKKRLHSGDAPNYELIRELNQYADEYSKIPNGKYITDLIQKTILYGSTLPAFKGESLSSRKNRKTKTKMKRKRGTRKVKRSKK